MAGTYFNVEKDPLMGDEEESEKGLDAPTPDADGETVVSSLSGHMGSKVYHSVKRDDKKKSAENKADDELEIEYLEPAEKLELPKKGSSAKKPSAKPESKKSTEVSVGSLMGSLGGKSYQRDPSLTMEKRPIPYSENKPAVGKKSTVKSEVPRPTNPGTTGKPGGAPGINPFDPRSLSIQIVERSVREHGKKKVLLRDIRLEVPAGSMVLILGGSGAGKTTFMNAVMGYEPAKGRISYNHMDVYKDHDKMKYEIGYVPQGHLLRDTDTVSGTLLNAAHMRMPEGLNPAEYQKKVDAVLKMFGLVKEKDSLVKKLSGGQEKRLSLAEQYIGNPSLFFLDEPDSGLDGPNSTAIMKNLRTIANEGKIVMVISHSPDRNIKQFDHLIVLAKDSRENCGRLVYYGAPTEALAFFGVESLEEVVSRINNTAEGGEGRADEFIDKFQGLTLA